MGNPENTDFIEITLKRKLDSLDSENGFDFRSTDYLLYPLKERYPLYYTDLIDRYVGLPFNDSSYVVSMTFQKEKFYHELYKKKYSPHLNEEREAQHYLNDTANLVKGSYKHLLNVLSSFQNGKHKLIVDADNDGSFNNNETMVFDRGYEFKNNMYPDQIALDTLPIIEVSYQISQRGKVIDLNRKVQIFPYPNYFYMQLYQEEDLKKHGLLLRLKDYWEGSINLDNTGYNFKAQGLSDTKIDFYIKPDSVRDYRNNTALNLNFRYEMHDTVLLSDNFYTIDSLILSPPKIFLNKINSKKENKVGSRMGYILPDYTFTDIENKEFSIRDLGNKKYVLLDFWGTWCQPCLKLIPRLKRMESQYKEKLNILGIAYNDSLESLLKFKSDNNIKWRQVYFKGKKGIIGDLKIPAFPTYVLLEKNGKIIYIGSAEEGLKTIDSLISGH